MSRENTQKNRENAPKKRMAPAFLSAAAKVFLYALILLALVRGVSVFYNFGHDIFYASSVDEPPGRDVNVNITEDMSFESLAKILYDAGVIQNEAAFRIQAKFFDFRMNAGEYIFNTSQTSRQILEMIDGGIVKSGKNDN